MDYSTRLAMSYYKTIATLNESHQIYLVQHTETSKIYVKKILSIFNNDVYNQLKENPILGTPKIYEIIPAEDSIVIIEEYISGLTLKEAIEQNSISKDDVLPIMIDLCKIVFSLHNQEPPIIHRDIKPSNVIITPYSKPVLLDFNAAKNLSQKSEDTVLLGTKGYAAPEQYGFGSSTLQTDIYSLGILLRDMTSHIAESNFCKDIIEKCTKLNPEERYKNINELIIALKSKLPRTKDVTSEHDINSLLSKYMIPGFRKKIPSNMILASIGYLFIICMSCTLTPVNTNSVVEIFLTRLCFFFVCISIIFISSNYLDVQSRLPLCNSKYQIIKVFGIILFDFLAMILVVLITMIFTFALI